MPALTAGSTFSGARPKKSRAIVIIVPVCGGTTDAMTMPAMSPRVIRWCSQRLVTRMPSSSDVRSRSVVSRQLCVSVVPLNTPRTMLVLPTSIARSM